MANYQIVPGSADQTINVFVPDASSSIGAGLAGLVYNSSSLICYFSRVGAAGTALTLATQTATGAHSDGGFVAIDGTNMPGWYRLDLSDAIVAAGVASVIVTLRGAANMVPVVCYIDLVTHLTAANVNAEVVDVLRTDTIPDSVAADAAQPTIAQALYEILQFLTEKSTSSTTLTVKKPDGSTSLMTFTLDSATAPTSITRAT